MGGGGSKPGVVKDGPRFDASYRMGEHIGKGAFSEVLTCVFRKTLSLHAVKVIDKKLMSAEDKASLQSEIDILQSLQHPHIIGLKEFYDEKDKMYIITEFVQGGELFDRIVRKERYSEMDARGLVKILLETMVYLHDKHIVHRDLKPENLLLMTDDNDMDIKVCDFGLAKRFRDLTENEMACGTPGYVAPEILTGKPYGAEVDIWSIGVITYILVVGYPPFYDEDQKKLFKRIKKCQYSFHPEHWDNKSPEVKDLIRHMICKEQSARWTAKQLLEHEWMKIDDSILEQSSLQSSQATLKSFNARRRFKAAAQAIILTNRIKALTGSIFRDIDAEKQEFKRAASVVFRADAEHSGDQDDVDDQEEDSPSGATDAEEEDASNDLADFAKGSDTIAEGDESDPVEDGKYSVVFVLGGPGSGKGTNCTKIVEKFGYTHLSAGDLLRAERNSGTKLAEMINDKILNGQLVPADITVNLLLVAMIKSGSHKFLVDGFPRDADNLSCWDKKMAAHCKVRFMLYLECTEETMMARLLERGKTSGRNDDNEESIRKRLKTYSDCTQPIIQKYRAMNKLQEVNSNRDEESVFADVALVFE